MKSRFLVGAMVFLVHFGVMAADRAPADWVIGASMDVKVIQVIDGDTLRVRGQSGLADVRLHGIDAPEWDQRCKDPGGKTFPCGQAATSQMLDLLQATQIPCGSDRMHGACVRGGLPVTCVVMDLDRKWGRPVAQCFAGRADIGREMISRGYATSAYSKDYQTLAAVSRFLKRGLWAGDFENPADFRRR